MIRAPEALEELFFWSDRNRNWKGIGERSRQFSWRVFSDASATDGGGSVEIVGLEEVFALSNGWRMDGWTLVWIY